MFPHKNDLKEEKKKKKTLLHCMLRVKEEHLTSSRGSLIG